MSFFSILSLIGYACLIRNNISQNDYKNFDLYLSVTLVTSVLFLFGIFHFLLIGYYLIFIIGVLILVYFFFKKNYIFFKKRYFYFILISFLFYILADFVYLKIWDDFFWGQFTKSIHFENKIYTANSLLQNHPRYTPGIPLFQNFFIFFFNKFEDKLLIFSNTIIVLSYSFIFFDFNTKPEKNLIFKIFIIFFILLILFFIFNHGFLYVEYYLSISLAAIMIFIQKNNQEHKDIFFLVIMILFLLLVKETAIIFIFLILLVILIRKNKHNLIKTLASTIIASIFIKFSWDYYTFAGGSKLEDFSFFLNGLFDFIKNFEKMSSIYLSTLNTHILDYGNFTSITRKFKIPDFGSITWILISITIAFANYFFSKKNLNQLLIGIYLFSIFYYMFILYIDYIFWGGKPIHFNRLSATFIVFLFLVQIYIFLDSSLAKYLNKIFLIILFFIFISFQYHKEKIYFSLKSYNSNQNTLLTKISTIKSSANYIKEKIKKNSKIYFIHQASSGFERTVFNYYIYPNEVNSTGWSLGKPYAKIDTFYNDIWTENLSNVEVKNKLLYDIPYSNKYRICCLGYNKRIYEYVFINKKDEKLWSVLRTFFYNKSDFEKFNFFKIINENNNIFFKPIKN